MLLEWLERIRIRQNIQKPETEIVDSKRNRKKAMKNSCATSLSVLV